MQQIRIKSSPKIIAQIARGMGVRAMLIAKGTVGFMRKWDLKLNWIRVRYIPHAMSSPGNKLTTILMLRTNIGRICLWNERRCDKIWNVEPPVTVVTIQGQMYKNVSALILIGIRRPQTPKITFCDLCFHCKIPSTYMSPWASYPWWTKQVMKQEENMCRGGGVLISELNFP